LSFDDPGDANAQQWGQLATAPPAHLVVHPTPVPLLKEEDFPALIPEIATMPPAHLLPPSHLLRAIDKPGSKTMDTPVLEAKAGNAWGTKPKDFSGTPASDPAANTAPAALPKSAVNPAAIDSKSENAWGTKQKTSSDAPAAKIVPDELPKSAVNAPGIDSKVGNAWETKQNLFPNAPAAIAPPVEFLRSMTVKDEGEDPMDPDSRSFSANKYYIDLLQKYRCPRRGCG